MTTRSRLLTTSVCVALAAGMTAIWACDSSQRGHQSPTDENGPPVETPTDSTTEAGDDPRAAELAEGPERADQPPEAGDLERFTRDLQDTPEDDGALVAEIRTNHGTIECRLFEQRAPVTVANFVGLARGLKAFVDPVSGEPVSEVRYYDDNPFHRVIPDRLVQSGDRTGHGHGGPGYTIPDEISDQLRHDRPGVLSMAHRGSGTAGSQFFITEQPLPDLDGDHAVFGHCDAPQIIRSISHVPTTGLGRPVDPAPRIETITFVRDDDPPATTAD